MQFEERMEAIQCSAAAAAATPLRSAVRRENNMPQLNAGPGYSETWISWSCQLCFQFRIKQDLKIYICTKVPSSILQISTTGYRSSLPHSIKTFVEIIIFYWPEWNLVKNDKNKIIFCAIFADSVAAVSVHQLCPRFQILMIKFAFHCIALLSSGSWAGCPGSVSLLVSIVIDMKVTRRELSVSGSDTALPQMINLSGGVQCDGVCSLCVHCR